MSPIDAVRLSNAEYSPTVPPVAIFVGGTSGVGQSMAELFARYTNGNAHIILVGRNREAAYNILSTFPKPTASSDWKHEFIPCDVTLMSNIHSLTASLLSRLTKVNFLVLSPGIAPGWSRCETEEGIDVLMALRYYSRWAFTNDLLPLLQKARHAGEDAKVMSVLGGGKRGWDIDLEDIAIRKRYYSLKAQLRTPLYNDLALEELSIRNPGISFIHIFPGFVATPINRVKTWPWKLLLPINLLLIWFVFTTQEDCGEYMLFALLNAEPGHVRYGELGDNVGMETYDGTDEKRRKLWEHTEEVVGL